MTFMPKDREKNLIEVQKEMQNESPSKSSEAFNVADMEKNLVKFEESRTRKSYQAGCFDYAPPQVTTIETRI